MPRPESQWVDKTKTKSYVYNGHHVVRGKGRKAVRKFVLMKSGKVVYTFASHSQAKANGFKKKK